MKVLVIGTGGREHAIALALAADPSVTEVHAAPGNPGIGAFAPLHDVDAMDGAAVASLATSIGADLVVVGPEAPLVAGVADPVRAAGIAVFGPSKDAALLEGSKAFSKEVMAAAGVPTAGSRTCSSAEEVAAALDEFGAPHVVKDDALAAGKGVVVTRDRDEAIAHAALCTSRGGGRVVIEEFLDGPEVSVFAVCDGSTAYALQPAQDFKRIFDGGRGANTGGMGSYSPLTWAPSDLADVVLSTIVQPTLDEMTRRGAPFVGCLYVGLALTGSGPKVIEFNCRFGDPDIQPVLALLDAPLGELLLAAAEGRLSEVPAPTFRDGAAVSVVLASAGYPESSSKGDVITGVGVANGVNDVDVIHAGTALTTPESGDPQLVTAGGRVLAVRALGYDVADARARAYAAADLISFDGLQRRSDIAAEPLGVVEGASVM
ncbi:MAG TPA: phosphoribosylamine--glycine ligase [Marmoricola sp.]